MSNKANSTAAIENHIRELAADGNTAKRIRGWLMFEHGIEGKRATELLQKAGVSSAGVAGSFEDMLNWLGEEPRSESDLYQHVIDNGTKNEARWIGQRNNIRKTINRVFEKANVKVTEKAVTEPQKAAIKAKVA